MTSMTAVMTLAAAPTAMVANHQGLRLMRPLKLNRRSVRLIELHLLRRPQSLSSSLMEVLERVPSSTVFTITAQ